MLFSSEVKHVHLDPSCILYGEIGLVPLQGELVIGDLWLGNQTIWTMGFICLSTLTLCSFYRLLLVTSFDLHLAKSLGMPVKIIQYGLMVILCLVLTASFESVGGNFGNINDVTART